MLLWKNIIPGVDPPRHVFALIEVPKGTRNKYEICKRLNVVLLDRVLHSSVIYPHDYGLIPGTYAQDGDPLDILVISSAGTIPLALVQAKPIGVLIMEDEKGVDEKILAVSENDPVYRDYADVIQLPQHMLAEIQEFYRTYKNLEHNKYATVREWRGRDAAHQIIENCIEIFKTKFGEVRQINPLEEESLD